MVKDSELGDDVRIMFGYIYKITNKINGKAYVGKTTDTVQVRWEEHLRDSRRSRCANRPLYSAIRKYGVDKFAVEVLEKVDLENLSERETYWIEYFHTYSDGYNATSGGDGKVLYDYDLIAKLLRKGRRYQEVSDIVGCCYDTVIFVAKKYNIDYIVGPPTAKPCIPVEQYDLEGHYIQSFNSCSDAARWLFENKHTRSVGREANTHIADALRGKYKTAYGFVWKKKISV